MRDDLERRIAESLSAVKEAARDERAPRRIEARSRVVSRSRRRTTMVWAGTAVGAAALIAVVMVVLSSTRPDEAGPREPDNGFADQITTFVEVGRHPFDLVVSAGVVWVTDTDRQVIHRIDAATTTIIDSIPIDGRPEDIDIRNGVVWVSNPELSSVYRFSEQTGDAIGSPVALSNEPVPLEMAAGDGMTWVLVDERELVSIDPETGEIGSRDELGAMDIAIGDGHVWALGLEGDLLEIDPATGAAVRSVPTTSAPGSDLTAGAGALWVADRASSTLTKYSIDTFEPLGQSPISGRYLDMTLGEGIMWVLSNDGGSPIVTGVSVDTGLLSGIVLRVEGDARQLSESEGILWVTDPAEAGVARVVPASDL
jgi:streptogramin lyase